VCIVIVCHCKAINDQRIRQLVASGVVELDHISQLCQAGIDCGGCHGVIEDLIEAHAETSVSIAC